MGGRLRGAGVAATAEYVRRLTRGNLDAPNLSRRLVRLTGSSPSSHVLSRSYTKSKAGLSGISPMATVRFSTPIVPVRLILPTAWRAARCRSRRSGLLRDEPSAVLVIDDDGDVGAVTGELQCVGDDHQAAGRNH